MNKRAQSRIIGFNMANPLPYYVTVLFRQGYGDRFATKQDALEYAEGEAHRLLAEYAELEREPFEGIYCERTDTKETWLFEYIAGIPTWVIDRDASACITEFPATDIFGQLD